MKIVCLHTPVSPRVPGVEGTSWRHWGHPFFDDVPLVEFMYLVFTRMPGGVTVDDVGLLLCPLSVECYYLPLFVDHCFLQTAATLWATAAGVADRYHYRQPQQWTMTAKGDHWSHGCALLASLCRLSLATETALRWQAGLWDLVTPDHWVVLLLPRLGWPRLNA